MEHGKTHPCKEQNRPGGEMEKEQRTACQNWKPVSYTHLDVYKRQKIHSAIKVITGLMESIMHSTPIIMVISVSYTHLPFLYRHMKNIPENGKFIFLDSGWMDETIRDFQAGRICVDVYKRQEYQ